MENQLKSISPLVSTLVLRNLGMYASCSSTVRISYLMDAVNLLVNEVGEEWLKEKYKEKGIDYEEIKLRLLRLNKLTSRCKTFYDSLEDKKFAKKDKENIIKKYYIETGSKIAVMQPELYNLFMFLVKNTTIQRMTPPHDSYKVLEHSQFRAVGGINRQRPQQNIQQPDVRIERE